ncbi:M48 family metalloprotease [Caldichromatium japonicum]|uniref:Putative beta-barrel assembly-enhancing protease n=1 Tax=Caldichromatium japonicum TaxID=2699430 RepID=A0A6G7VDT0_9GAMM|nr:M48 family metalloprotease [Caldichromatium japonicum]QIK38112.1 M48 family metalloprotease [Caldichromatium japonicum]
MIRIKPIHFNLRFALVALSLGAISLPQAQTQDDRLPEMGSSAETVMTPGAEQRLGQSFMRKVRETLPLLDDPLALDYLEGLGAQLLTAAHQDPSGFRFFIIDQSVVNALAGPGGHIGVYTGLILAAKTESELAAVIAHEIAHISQRHLLRSLEEQNRLLLPTAALLIAGAILGAQVSGDAGAAAIAGAQAALLQRQINFTREHEHEADRIGITMLAQAGFDPYAMAGFFEHLSKASRVTETSTPELLRTHPVNANRIAEALVRADTFGVRQRLDSLRFHLTRAALRERSYKRPEQAIEHFNATLQSGRYREARAEHYGLALALLRAGRIEVARQALEQARQGQGGLAEFVILNARLDLEQGQTEQAVRSLKDAVALDPERWPLRLAYAEALLKAGRAAQAIDELLAVARLRPSNPVLYDRLEQAAIRAGNLGATHRFRAERLYAEGECELAIRQLEIALRQRDLPYHEAARIQARLETWKEEERDAKRNKRGER